MIAGTCIAALGGIWLLMWAISVWFVRAGVYPQGGYKPWVSREQTAEANERGREFQRKQAALFRRGWVFAVAAIVVGVVVAIV